MDAVAVKAAADQIFKNPTWSSVSAAIGSAIAAAGSAPARSTASMPAGSARIAPPLTRISQT
jgi:hypothetical protein